MRVIVFGAGAVGSLIGVRLHKRGYDVTLIARGANYEALSKRGAVLETPQGTVTSRVPVVDHPSKIQFQPSDVVILSVKSQATTGALDSLVPLCDPRTAIVCAQNGVENERLALRHFNFVYGMYVMCQAIHLTPGVVRIPSAPISAILDVGRWPGGNDETSRYLVDMLNESTFDSVARHDIARWKWGKLIRNLGNAAEAICGSATRGGDLIARAMAEGVSVLNAAGIDFVGGEVNLARREGVLDIAGHEFGGGSSWQSLMRKTGNIESDYLNGEIVLQGRLDGVATPVNELLQRLASEMAHDHLEPGRWSEADILEML